MPKREKRYSAPALEKGLEIIELLARTPDGLGLTAISEHLGRTKTELFRMLAVLHDAGYLDYSDSDQIYKLSLKLFRISHRFAPVHNLTKLAMPIMQRVCHQTAQSCHLVVYSMGGGLILAQQHAEDDSNRLTLPVGGGGPLLNNCAGHVLLSFSSPDRRARMLQEQARYCEREVDHSHLSTLVNRVRKQGYESMASPVLLGVHDIGFPIMDRFSHAIAVLMVSSLLYKNTSRNPDLCMLAQTLEQASSEISRQLGYAE